MIYTLKNQEITIQVHSHGAELKSLTDNHTGQEYMWCADEAYWKRTAPVLFPVVGAYRNNEMRYQGKTYKMSQHGFARDMEFELAEQTEDSIFLSLEDTPETWENYPFAFRLELGYRLKDRTVEVIWRVKNPAEEPMYFSIGGHPAFNCPLSSGEKQTDYRIAFTGTDKIVSSLFGATGVTDTKIEYPLEDGILPITEDLFDNDALVIENYQTKRVALVNPEGKAYLTVDFEVPVFGLWSPPKKNAPFICIEPWYGRADGEHFDGEIQDREWGNGLAPGEVFEASYFITVNE